MIVQGKNKATGKFEAQVYDADNNLFATVEGDSFKAVELRAFDLQREALMPVMFGSVTINESLHTLEDIFAEMSDDELLAELAA